MKYTILLLLLLVSVSGRMQWQHPAIIDPHPFFNPDDDCWYIVLENQPTDSAHFAIYRSVKNRKFLFEGNHLKAIEFLLNRMDSLENRTLILEKIVQQNL
jgi:hypothetical protein